jgi:hypothetical protein
MGNTAQAKTIDFGYNIQPFLKTHDAAYRRHDKLIFEHTAENEKIVDEMEHIKNLLASVNKDRRKNQAIDYGSTDPAKKELVDTVKKINPNLIAEGCYSWKEEEIDRLVENLNNHTKHLTTVLNPKMMYITQLFQDRNRITEIIGEIVKMYREESTAIVRNQRK